MVTANTLIRLGALAGMWILAWPFIISIIGFNFFVDHPRSVELEWLMGSAALTCMFMGTAGNVLYLFATVGWVSSW